MNDQERDQVKQVFREQHGIEVTDQDINHAAQAANEAVVRKSAEMALLPLRRHLWEHHHTTTLIGMGKSALESVHKVAPKQGSHPAEEEMTLGEMLAGSE